MIDCKVIYGLIDQTISEDSKNYSFSSKTVYSQGSNILIRESKNDLVYLESNRTLLDGSFIFPDSNQPQAYDVGWESENLSDADGALSEFVEFDFTDTHDLYGFIFNFQTLIVDFKVEFYKDTTLIDTISVTGNTDLEFKKIVSVLQWDKIRISVTKISKPYQRARIGSVVFGISFDFDNDNLVSVDATKAVSIKNDNTDSAQCNISFFNLGLFDIKTIKDLPVGLQSGMRVSVYFGSKLFNEYIVDSTEVEDEGKVINLTCYDRLYYLNDTTFNIGKVYSDGRSLYDWAMEVAEDANIDIVCDNSLKNITSKGYIGAVSHREALRMIAEAGNCNIIVQDGSISIVPFATTAGTDLTRDDILEDSLDISNEDKILGVTVKQYQFSKSSTTTGLSENQDILLTGETQTITASYSSSPAEATSVSCSTNITISSQKLGSENAVIAFTGTAGETGWITIVGKQYNKSTADVSSGYIDSHVKEIDNTLIADATMAKSVCDFQLTHSASNYTYSLDTQVDLSAKLLETITAIKYQIVVSSVEISLDSDNESMILGGEDYGE